MTLTTSPARQKDISAIAGLAKQVFTNTYGAVIPKAILQPYLAQSFSESQLTSEIEQPHIHYHLAKQDNKLVGYCKLAENQPPSCVQSNKALELVNLYIDPIYQNLGMGTHLMKQALAYAQSHAFQHLWLCTWKQNDQAIHFYKKFGFQVVGSHEIWVDTILFDDWVMVQALAVENT